VSATSAATSAFSTSSFEASPLVPLTPFVAGAPASTFGSSAFSGSAAASSGAELTLPPMSFSTTSRVPFGEPGSAA